MRPPPTAEELKALLALVGLQVDTEAAEALRRRIGFFQDAMDALDWLDLGMTDPAFLYRSDADET